MVRNSLRGSVSTLSLRSSRIEDDNSAATRARVAELEAQLRELRLREATEKKDIPRMPSQRQSTPSEDTLAMAEMYRKRYARDSDLPKNTLFAEFDKYADGNKQGDTAWNNTSDLMAKYGREFPAIPEDYPISSRLTTEDEIEAQTKSLFQKYNESLGDVQPKKSLITKALVGGGSQLKSPEAYAQPFCDFLTDNPTVFHAVNYFEKKLAAAGFKKVKPHITYQLFTHTL
jgi:hypothetical protein